MKPDLKNIDEVVNRYLPSASKEVVAEDLAQIMHRLQSGTAQAIDPAPRSSSGLWLGIVAAAALLLMAFTGVMIWRQDPAPARLEAADGSRKVEFGEIVRANNGTGSLLQLADGSRVEMKVQSELYLEEAEDGVRIRLNKGGVVVNAAKQRTGHLYVQTRDLLVSVIGTVFLVNAEEEGSRVAVYEGEVRVKQGASETTLRSGEQVASNPTMKALPMKEAPVWSSQAATNVAIEEDKPAFEEVSVRPSKADFGGGRGAAGRAISGCEGSFAIQLDPRRFAVVGTTLHALVTWVYGTGKLDYDSCRNSSSQNLISGGPGWIRTDLWDIQAVIQAGNPNLTAEQLKKGEVPKLRAMLKTFLEKRFKLVVRSETKEVSAYTLTAEKGAPRLTIRAEIDTEVRGMLANQKPGVMLERGVIFVKDASIADLIPLLERDIGQPILDQTGLAEQYSFFIEYTPLSRQTPFVGPVLFKALPEQVGLRLTETKTTVTTWVIEQAEKPSGN